MTKKGTMSRRRLKRTQFQGIDWSNKNLREVDFSGEDLRGANFNGSDLRGANFNGSDLRDCDFSRCNLGGAKFVKAKLNNSNFNSAFSEMPRRWKALTTLLVTIILFISNIATAYSVSLFLFIADIFGDAQLIPAFSEANGFPRWITFPIILSVIFTALYYRRRKTDIFIVLTSIFPVASVTSILIIAFIPGSSNPAKIGAGAVASSLVALSGGISGLLLRAQIASLIFFLRDEIPPLLLGTLDWLFSIIGILAGVILARHSQSSYMWVAFLFAVFLSWSGSKLGYFYSVEFNSGKSFFSLNSIAFQKPGKTTVFRDACLKGARFDDLAIDIEFIDVARAEMDESLFTMLSGRSDEDRRSFMKISDSFGDSDVRSHLVFKSIDNLERRFDTMVDENKELARKPSVNQTFVAPVYGGVTGINEGNITNYFGKNTNEIVTLMKALSDSIKSLPGKQKEDAQIHFEDLEGDLRQDKPSLPKLKVRIIALLGIALTLGGYVANTADFVNNILDLSDKLQVPITELQPQLQEFKQLNPEFVWPPR